MVYTSSKPAKDISIITDEWRFGGGGGYSSEVLSWRGKRHNIFENIFKTFPKIRFA